MKLKIIAENKRKLMIH